MTVIAIALLCVAALVAQYRHHLYRGINLESRVKALEARQVEAFDAKAFAELVTKVEALRIARGMR